LRIDEEVILQSAICNLQSEIGWFLCYSAKRCVARGWRCPVKKLLVLLLLLSLVVGCAGRAKKKQEQEEKETANAGKAVVLELTTGDRIEGKVMRETPEAITILGKGGVGTFPGSLVTKVEESKPPAPEEYKPRPPAAKYEAQEPEPFAAIRGMKVFHRATCTLLNHQPKSKIVPYATRQEALSDGLKPCGTCNPMSDER